MKKVKQETKKQAIRFKYFLVEMIVFLLKIRGYTYTIHKWNNEGLVLYSNSKFRYEPKEKLNVCTNDKTKNSSKS